jgi:hypothetical protein
MFLQNTVIGYSLLLLKSNEKRSFEGLGRIVEKSGDTIYRRLPTEEESAEQMAKNAQEMFRNKKTLTATLDDTLIKKNFAEHIEGTWPLCDAKNKRLINGYRLMAISVTDGKILMPIKCNIALPRELNLLPEQKKFFIIQQLILEVIRIFKDKEIVIAADGAFATKALLGWCSQMNIKIEVRMHSNRVVEHNGKKAVIRNMLLLKLNGLRLAHTIKVFWNGLWLFLTACRRIDKHGDETIVYQAANFEAQPRKHVQFYKNRWNTESLFRTTKQKLGLQECFSRKFDIQLRHMSAVLLAYSIAQLEAKKAHLEKPEDVIKLFRSNLYEC